MRICVWVSATVLVRIAIAVTNHLDQDQLGDGRALFIWLMLPQNCLSWWKSRRELKQGRILEARADAETMEGCYLLACFSWLAQMAFLQKPGPSAPGWSHAQWTVLLNQLLIKKILYKLAYSLIIWKHFVNWGSFLSDDFRLCQVDRKLANTATQGRNQISWRWSYRLHYEPPDMGTGSWTGVLWESSVGTKVLSHPFNPREVDLSAASWPSHLHSCSSFCCPLLHTLCFFYIPVSFFYFLWASCSKAHEGCTWGQMPRWAPPFSY